MTKIQGVRWLFRHRSWRWFGGSGFGRAESEGVSCLPDLLHHAGHLVVWSGWRSSMLEKGSVIATRFATRGLCGSCPWRWWPRISKSDFVPRRFLDKTNQRRYTGRRDSIMARRCLRCWFTWVPCWMHGTMAGRRLCITLLALIPTGEVTALLLCSGASIDAKDVVNKMLAPLCGRGESEPTDSGLPAGTGTSVVVKGCQSWG